MLWVCFGRGQRNIGRLRLFCRLDSDIAETSATWKRRTDGFGVQRAAALFFSAKLH